MACCFYVIAFRLKACVYTVVCMCICVYLNVFALLCMSVALCPHALKTRLLTGRRLLGRVYDKPESLAREKKPESRLKVPRLNAL